MSMDQLSKVANPARGQLNRENSPFPVSPVAPENLGLLRERGSAVPSRVSLVTLHTQSS